MMIVTARHAIDDNAWENDLNDRFTMIVELQRELALIESDRDAILQRIATYAARLPGADGVAVAMIEFAVSHGVVLHCQNTEIETRVNGAACYRLGMRSFVAVPLSHDRKAIDGLEVIASAPNAFGAMWRRYRCVAASSRRRSATSDNGIGFDETYREKVFTIFQRLRTDCISRRAHSLGDLSQDRRASALAEGAPVSCKAATLQRPAPPSRGRGGKSVRVLPVAPAACGVPPPALAAIVYTHS